VHLGLRHRSPPSGIGAPLGAGPLGRRVGLVYDSAMTNAKAVVLLSGGMDSATAAAMTKARGFDLYALSFRYGQRHALELEAALRVAAGLGVVRHAIVDIDLRSFGGSALTADIAVPKD